jgi:transcriptional regulator with XRE-family HTH domain
MPRREAPLLNLPTHRLEFASALREQRLEADLTLRQVGAAAHYSHVHMGRISSGNVFPTWEATEAFLVACHVTDPDVLADWQRRWRVASEQEDALQDDLSARGRQRRRPPRHAQPQTPPTRPPAAADTTPSSHTEAHSDPAEPRHIRTAAGHETEELMTFLRQATSKHQLGEAFTKLGRRTGCDSLRKAEDKSGIPRATLGGWYSGRRQPSAAAMNTFLVALGANPPEQRAFANYIQRLWVPQSPPQLSITLKDPQNYLTDPIHHQSVPSYIVACYEIEFTCQNMDIDCGVIFLSSAPSNVMGVVAAPDYAQTRGISFRGLVADTAMPLWLWVAGEKLSIGDQLNFFCSLTAQDACWDITVPLVPA